MHNLNSKLKIFCKYTFKVFLSQKGHVFESDTDTEVIAKLVRCAKKIHINIIYYTGKKVWHLARRQLHSSEMSCFYAVIVFLAFLGISTTLAIIRAS